MDLSFIDFHAVAVLAITGVTFWLFAQERLPIQSTALLALLALMLLFGLFPYDNGGRPLGPAQFLAGFGHTALVTICFLMVLGRGLSATGALEPFVRQLARLWAIAPTLAFFLLLVFCMAISGLLNNTAVVILLIPVLVSVATRTNTSATQTLMPMNYAMLIGGMTTTIGTSTNLLVVGIAEDLGVQAFGLFEFAWIVVIAALVALPYLLFVVPRLMPSNLGNRPQAQPRSFDVALEIHGGSSAVGWELRKVMQRIPDFKARELIRNGQAITRLPSVQLRSGDRLLVNLTPDLLREYATVLGVWVHPREQFEVPGSPSQAMAQALIASEAGLASTAPSASRFAEQHGLAVIGIQRPSQTSALDPADVAFRPGDVLLLRGAKDGIEALRAAPGFLMLDAIMELPHTQRAPLSLAIMAGVVLLAALNLLPMVLASAVGVAAMLLTGCLRWNEATDSLSAKVVMIVVSSLALGEALTATGLIAMAGHGLAALGNYLPPFAMVASLMLLMAIVTNFVSNNAAAIIGTPIAITMAATLGLDPRPFVLAVLFGANISYATPMGYQTNLLVMSAAGYRFKDFVRAGVPLAVLMWITLTWLLSMEYNLI